jgi:outer membrane lipoprotein carrier protein
VQTLITPTRFGQVRQSIRPAPHVRQNRPTGRRRSLAVALTLALALTPLAARASDALARVESYLGSLKTLSAEFVQVVQDRKGDVTERASGTLAMSRPDRFRWEYREPYAQTIVADGSKLWLYDPDLEQVTVRTLAQGLGTTPAMLLSGSGKVGEAFTAGPVEKRQDWTWCRLVPKERGSDFERVSLAFDSKNELAAMELVDKLGQTTTIQFTRVNRRATIADSTFRFVPPKGADVIGEAAAR